MINHMKISYSSKLQLDPSLIQLEQEKTNILDMLQNHMVNLGREL